MLVVLPKWKVTVYGAPDGETTTAVGPSITVYVHDKFAANVLRKVADIEFEFEPTRYEITLMPANEQTGTAVRDTGDGRNTITSGM